MIQSTYNTVFTQIYFFSLSPSGLPTKSLYWLSCLCALYVSQPSYRPSPWLNPSSEIWGILYLHIMKALITHFPLTCCYYSLSLLSPFSSSEPYFQTPSVYVLPLGGDTYFHATTERHIAYSCALFASRLYFNP